MSTDRPTRTLMRGLAVLESLAESDEPLGVTEVAKRVGLDKATSLRLLNTLVAAGYATQTAGDSRYWLASKVVRLSERFTTEQPFRDVAVPHLEQLRDQTNETVHLGQLQGVHVVYIEKLDTSQSVRLSSVVGQTMPLHTTALGKALLASQPAAVRDRLIERLDLTPRQPNSIQTVETLHEDIAKTLERGYAVEVCENEDGVACVGAAIVVQEQVIGGVSVAGPSFRIEPFMSKFGELAAAAAHAIGEDETASRSGHRSGSDESSRDLGGFR